MGDLLVRFLVGGTVVSIFSVMADALRPKSFAGLLGAAPSIALASVGLTIHDSGKTVAVLESRSMMLGAIAFLAYAAAVSWVLRRFRVSTAVATTTLMPIWLGVSLGLCWLLGWQ